MEDILKRLADSSPNESSHELQCRCYDAAAEISRLRNAIAETLEENGYLADGENCTLIKLKMVMPMAQGMCKCGMPWESDMDQFGCWSCGAEKPAPVRSND